MRKILLFMALLLYGMVITAQTVHEIRDSVKIYFLQGKTELVPELRGNQSSLNQIIKRLRSHNADTLYRLREVEVVGAASPEGSIPLNRELSRKRTIRLPVAIRAAARLPPNHFVLGARLGGTGPPGGKRPWRALSGRNFVAAARDYP